MGFGYTLLSTQVNLFSAPLPPPLPRNSCQGKVVSRCTYIHRSIVAAGWPANLLPPLARTRSHPYLTPTPSLKH